MRALLALALLLLSTACTPAPPRPPEPLTRVVTLAGDGFRVAPSGLTDPFGVAVAKDGTVFVTDGKSGRLYRIASDGAVGVAVEGLDMPSAVALAPDGSLVVANTGANAIVRFDPATGAITTLADAASDGERFDAPVGVAVAPDGTVFVADTYNDRIRAIAPDGAVRTIAGGPAPGFADGTGDGARFDTPCGLAVAPDGALLVADTGNTRIRRVALDGTVTTLSLGDELGEPTALAVRADGGALFVADASESCIWMCELGPTLSIQRFAGGNWSGRTDGDLPIARLDRPTGVALAPDGSMVVADSANGAVRAIVAGGAERGRVVSEPTVAVDVAEVRAAIPPRWPYDPPDRPREIAATFGEVRSESGDEIWLHGGLDIPGGYGEVARAVLSERVTRPLSAAAPGGRSEFLRLPVFTYIHVRVGRDADDHPLPGSPFEVWRDAENKVARVRLRRGERIEAGQPVGTLNRVNHVHLSMGPPGAEVNALTVLSLPGLVDTTAPTIEDVTLADEANQPVAPDAARGRVRVLVRAWDRTDRNAERRRLGLFRLGYQLVDTPGFDEPRMNISFERLPVDPRGGRFAFAEGSRSWFTGPTVFVYQVTNVVRGGESREDFLDLTPLAPGRYTLRVFAEDAFGNRATRDLVITKPG